MIIVIYVLAIVTANYSAEIFGPDVTPINAFLFIGLDLTIRNIFGSALSIYKMLLVICSAGFISYALNPATGIIAFASLCAFVLSALSDWLVFNIVKGDWMKKCIGGVSVGAAVDSFVFPTIAFGSVFMNVIALQFAAKLLGGLFWAALIIKVKKVLR